jgi:hypothetical protein
MGVGCRGEEGLDEGRKVGGGHEASIGWAVGWGQWTARAGLGSRSGLSRAECVWMRKSW